MAWDPRYSSSDEVLDALLADLSKKTKMSHTTSYRRAIRYREWDKKATALASKIGMMLADPTLVTLTPELEKLLNDAATLWPDISVYWVRVQYYLDTRGIKWPK